MWPLLFRVTVEISRLHSLTGVVSPLDGRSYGVLLRDQLTREITHVSACFRRIHRWLPRACLGVESSTEENVVL
jgi:hypothetical protein